MKESGDIMCDVINKCGDKKEEDSQTATGRGESLQNKLAQEQ